MISQQTWSNLTMICEVLWTHFYSFRVQQLTLNEQILVWVSL